MVAKEASTEIFAHVVDVDFDEGAKNRDPLFSSFWGKYVYIFLSKYSRTNSPHRWKGNG